MSERNLRSREAYGIAVNSLICSTCGEEYFLKSKFDKHILSHAETVFSCNSCDKSFNSFPDLELHSRLHKRSDQYNQSYDCKNQFTNQSEPLQHMHTTHREHPIAKNEELKAAPLKRKTPLKNFKPVSPNFKNHTETHMFPKIVQVGTVPADCKMKKSPIIFGIVGEYSPSHKLSNNSSGIKPILKAPGVNIEKVSKPPSWEDFINAKSEHHQSADALRNVKRISEFSQESVIPKKQRKIEQFTKVKQDAISNTSVDGSGLTQSKPLICKNSDIYFSTKKCDKSSHMPSAETAIKRVGETTLSPINTQTNLTAEKQMINPVKAVSYPVLPNQPNPVKDLTSVQVINIPDKKISKAENQCISTDEIKTTNAPKIIINLPQQGLIQPGQQLISANLFAGKTFVVQKGPNAVTKGSSNEVRSQSQFVKQRVVLKPVLSPKPFVEGAIQPLASSDKQLLSPRKPQQKICPFIKRTDLQDASLESNAPDTNGQPKEIKSPDARKLDLHKSESSYNSSKVASSSAFELQMPKQSPSTLVINKASSVTRSGRYRKNYSTKENKLDIVRENEKDNLSQKKNNFSSPEMNAIGLENLTDLKILLPAISVKKLPDSVYKECIRNGFINMKNLHKKLVMESKKVLKKRAINVNTISKNNKLQNIKTNELNIIEEKKLISCTRRKTRSTAKEHSNDQIHKIKALENTQTLNLNAVHSLNVEDLGIKGNKVNSSTRETRSMKNRHQDVSNQQIGNVNPNEANCNKNEKFISPTLLKTKQSIEITNEMTVSPTKGNLRKKINVKNVELIPSNVQESDMKTAKNIPRSSIKPNNIVSVQNVPTNNEIENSPNLAVSISKPALTSSVTPSNDKVQIMLHSENVKANEINFANDGIISSSAIVNNVSKPVPSSLASPSNIKVVPVTADFMRKLKESLFKSSPCADSNNIRVVVPSDMLKKIQVPATHTVINSNVKMNSENSTLTDDNPVKASFVKSSRSNIRNFENLDEMLENEKKRLEEKEKIKKKEKILKKMLVKYEEKEERKQAKYFQKKLLRFIEKNQDFLHGSEEKLFEVISNSSKILEELKGLKHASETAITNELVSNVLLKSLKDVDSSLKDVDEGVKQKEGKKSTQEFVNMSASRAEKKSNVHSASSKGKNKIIKHSPISSNPKSKNIISSALSSDSVYVYDPANETRMEGKTDQISYSKRNNITKKNLRKRFVYQKQVLKPYGEDPFTDMSIITNEKFTIECPCQKENCDGLHPELLE
ncbi:hypothetical protein HNY73_015581 [Argiope bruennichi]|uniref:C2H2-type domain-containing protein n=1 Tax=Argiope bruennichi TaxID=94029 RepID=A0A8T0ESQ3_ARGBR|nr:hypothetical protein HNY73_015581 [Argiope bruennichi]